jgi:peptidoglycan/xylan/chitin deacetylase (PgdA/CDA1 family)
MTISWHRWLVKKSARRAFVLASVACAPFTLPRGRGKRQVRAITYHRFGHARRDPWCLTPEAFDLQMRFLAEHRLAVSLHDVLRFARGEIALPDNSVLVTIDDGFRSVLSVAAPILARYRIPAVAYITTSVVENVQAAKPATEPYLTWAEVVELDRMGVAIGSHAHTHRSMAKLDRAEVRAEGQRSKDLIEQRLGKEVSSFAYPFGMRRDESAVTLEVLAECGYESLFISQHGKISPGADPLRLPRVKLEGGEPDWMFKRLYRGGMDAWGMVDRLL